MSSVPPLHVVVSAGVVEIPSSMWPAPPLHARLPEAAVTACGVEVERLALFDDVVFETVTDRSTCCVRCEEVVALPGA